MSQSLLNTDGPASAERHVFAEYRFDCPELPDAFVVHEFEALEALNTPYRWTVRLHPEHEATDSYQLLGRNVTLTIEVRGAERCFRGIVDRVTVDHRGAHLRQHCNVLVVPALFALSRTLDTRIFQDKTALEIVEEVLRESLSPYGRTFESGSVDAGRLVTRNYCVQYRETRLDFVHRLLEEEGIGYYFRHENEAETLVLFDHNGGLRRASAPEVNPVQFWIGAAGGTGSQRMIFFPGTSNRTSTDFATRDYDWRLGSRGTLEHKSAISTVDARGPHEVYEHGVGRHHVIHEDTNMLLGMGETLVTSIVAADLPAPLADRVFDLKGSLFDRFSTSNTEDRGRIRREWHERDAHVFEGISSVTALSAGTAFELAGSLGADGEYFVTRITHSSAAPPSSLVGDELVQLNYHNRIHCLPRATPWRPDCVTSKPRIDGVQTATVTGPPGLEIYTDPHGRIKVHFPWDRAETDLTGHYTCWLRVSQAWAGATSPAFLFIPRVGMEVVVSFIDGDPDRPLVTGCVYNGDNPTPAMLPLQATKSIIRTRTVPMGIGYNELSFEDAMGMERVFLRAERDLSELVQNNHDVRVHRNERISVGENRTESVGRDEQMSVGRHYTRNIGGRSHEVVGSNHTRSVGGSAREQISCDYDLEVDGVMTTEVQGQALMLAGRAFTVLQGEVNLLRMSDEESTDESLAGKGVTVESDGSRVHLTKDQVDVSVDGSNILVKPGRIELTVGGSSLVITPELIQVNGKTLPAAGSPKEPPST